MKAAAVQFRPLKGQTQKARLHIAALAEEALSNNADIVVFPEMATSGYIWENGNELLPHAESARGALFGLLSPLAARYGGWIICGFPELGEGDALYNSALIISPDGELSACYRKILLFDADKSWALPGYIRLAIDASIGRIIPGICMDLNDDAFIDFAARSNAQIIPFPTNWIEEGADVWSYWKMRLEGFSGVLIAANCWGHDGAVEFCGHSAIFGSGMELLAYAGREGDEIIYAEI